MKTTYCKKYDTQSKFNAISKCLQKKHIDIGTYLYGAFNCIIYLYAPRTSTIRSACVSNGDEPTRNGRIVSSRSPTQPNLHKRIKVRNSF